MPGPVSDSSQGPGDDTPYVPSWCYEPDGPRMCLCGHHEGYHSDEGQCLHAHHFSKCGCTGFRCPVALEEINDPIIGACPK